MSRPWKDRLPAMWEQIQYSENPASYAGQAYIGLKIKFNDLGLLIDCQTEGIDRGTSGNFPGLFYLLGPSKERKIDQVGFGLVPADLVDPSFRLFVPPGHSLSNTAPTVTGAELKAALPNLIESVQCLNDDLTPDPIGFMGMRTGPSVSDTAKIMVDTVFRRLCSDSAFQVMTLAPTVKETTEGATDRLLTYLETFFSKRRKTNNWSFSVNQSSIQLGASRHPGHVSVKRQIAMRESIPPGVLHVREDSGSPDLAQPSKDGCIFIAPRFSGRGSSDAALKYALRVFGGYTTRELKKEEADGTFRSMHDLVQAVSGYAQQSLANDSPLKTFLSSLAQGLAPFHGTFNNDKQSVTVCVPSRHVKKS